MWGLYITGPRRCKGSLISGKKVEKKLTAEALRVRRGPRRLIFSLNSEEEKRCPIQVG
jgi:hypothetical protein